MIRRIEPGQRSGTVEIPSSKSHAHRMLICAALSREESVLRCRGLSKDILATMDCLRALGAEIREEQGLLFIRPIAAVPAGERVLPCGESGTTLRLLLPLVGALGAEGMFLRKGRLPQRPLSPLDRELCRHGVSLIEEGVALHVKGRLLPGDYYLPGNISSQFISGLLLALPFLQGDSSLTVEGKVESAGYLRMTEQTYAIAGVSLHKKGQNYRVPGGQRPCIAGEHTVEGDWSNAAFFLCAGALSDEGVLVKGLSLQSCHGDMAVLELLRRFGAQVRADAEGVLVRRGQLRGIHIDAAPIPDLIPVLSVLASFCEGETRVYHAGRLRLKESDRLRTTAALIRSLGGEAEELAEGLVIRGKGGLRGGEAESFNDHRIAMAAAAASCGCEEAVLLHGAECVEKSYPVFWKDWDELTRNET